MMVLLCFSKSEGVFLSFQMQEVTVCKVCCCGTQYLIPYVNFSEFGFKIKCNIAQIIVLHVLLAAEHVAGVLHVSLCYMLILSIHFIF